MIHLWAYEYVNSNLTVNKKQIIEDDIILGEFDSVKKCFDYRMIKNRVGEDIIVHFSRDITKKCVIEGFYIEGDQEIIKLSKGHLWNAYSDL